MVWHADDLQPATCNPYQGNVEESVQPRGSAMRKSRYTDEQIISLGSSSRPTLAWALPT